MRKSWKKYKIAISLPKWILLENQTPTVLFLLRFENYMKQAVYEYDSKDNKTGLYYYKLKTVEKRK